MHQDVCAGNTNDYAINVQCARVWYKVKIVMFPPTSVCWCGVDVHVKSVLITRYYVYFCEWAERNIYIYIAIINL